MFTLDNFLKPTMIKVNGVELEVFEAGRENTGKPIVLCHGWPEHAFSWRHQVPALVKAGYHVIVPNQRGYGRSSQPQDVSAYDIEHLTGDLIGLLDHYGYSDATFVGHDWGATVVWGLALLHPNRVSKIINLSVPYQARGEKPWLEFLEELFGPDNYFIHFNRQPGVADGVFEDNTEQFLRNMFRKNEPPTEPEPGMALINLARRERPLGQPVMSDEELDVFISAFKTSGFTGSVNWYRNLDKNWHILGQVNSIINHPTLMIYGEKDPVMQSPNLSDFVPNVHIESLDCGHWIQQEEPEKTNKIILAWLHELDK